MDGLRFVPLTAAVLPRIEPWFDDPDTQRWLGNRDWLSMIRRLSENPPAERRGRPVVSRGAWVIEKDHEPVSVVDVETYTDATAGLALVIAPARRGQGLCRRALQDIIDRLAAEGIEEVFVGVEPDNMASIRCMEAAGFVARSPDPDAEGFLYFARRKRSI